MKTLSGAALGEMLGASMGIGAALAVGIKGLLNFGVGFLTGAAGLWDIPKGSVSGILNKVTKIYLNSVIGGVLKMSVDAIYATILEEKCGWINGLKSIINRFF